MSRWPPLILFLFGAAIFASGNHAATPQPEPKTELTLGVFSYYSWNFRSVIPA